MHCKADGMKMFNCATCYDFYVIQKCKPESRKTLVKYYDGMYNNVDLSQYDWIENENPELLKKFIATSEQPKL